MDTFLSSTHSFQRQSQLCKYSGINSCSRQNPSQNFNPKTYIDFLVNLCLIQKLLSQVSYVQMPLDLRAWIGLTHLCHDVYSNSFVWTFQTFENNLECNINSQKIWRRVADSVVMNNSPSNIFSILLLLER